MSNDTPKVIDAPDAIWLCYGDLPSDLVHPKNVSIYDDEITWSHNAIDASDVKYVRADIVDGLVKSLKLVMDEYEGLLDPDRVENRGFEKYPEIVSACVSIAKAEGALNNEQRHHQR